MIRLHYFQMAGHSQLSPLSGHSSAPRRCYSDVTVTVFQLDSARPRRNSLFDQGALGACIESRLPAIFSVSICHLFHWQFKPFHKSVSGLI